MEVKIWPRGPEEKGGYAMMPMRKNIPVGRDGWELTKCPVKIMEAQNIANIVYIMMNALMEWSVMEENLSNRIVSEGSGKIFLIWKLLKQALRMVIFECKKHSVIRERSGQ